MVPNLYQTCLIKIILLIVLIIALSNFIDNWELTINFYIVVQ